jgi:hypothetical protein
MILTLYKTTDADNVIGKTLTGALNIAIRLKATVDISSPELLLGVIEGVDYKEFNYCSIDVLGKKYFIRSVEAVTNTLYRLVCEVDVLETYKTEILACTAKVQKRLGAGDYGETSLEFTGDVEVSNYVSSVELTPVDNSLFSVLRWS